MKVKLTGADEWYPVYGFKEPGHPWYEYSGREVDVDPRVVKRWIKARDEFNRMQDELQELEGEA